MALEGLESARVCETAAQCFEGEQCIEGFCSLEGKSPAALIVEFEPPEGPSAWLDAGTLADTHEVSHVFQAPVRVNIVVHSERAEDSIPALVVFSRPSPIGRAPIVITAEAGGEGADLPPGCWEIRVFPAAPDAPPFVLAGPADGTCFEADDIPAELSVPPSGRLIGRVVWADGSGVEGAEVVALSEDGAREASARVLTGVCDDGERLGCFVLAVARSEVAVRIRIGEPAGAEAGILPTVEIDRSLVPFPDPPEEAPPQDIGDLTLDAFGPPIRFGGIVEGVLASGETVPVPGARVTLRSQDHLGTPEQQLPGDVQRETLAGIDGAFEVVLLAGTYDVRVLPPDDGDLGTLAVLAAVQLVNDPDGDLYQAGQTFLLGPKTNYAGELRLSGVEGVSAGGIAIDLLGGSQLFSAEDPFREESANRPIYGATADDGTFAMEVDPGRYDAYFRPAPGAAAAWTIVPGLDLREDDVDASEILRSGSVLVGTVSSSSGAPAPRVTVRMYAEVGNGILQVGEAITDANGDYLTFLPADL